MPDLAFRRERLSSSLETHPVLSYTLVCMTSNDDQYQVCHILTMIDGATEEMVEFWEITHFSLADFREQFDVPTETDPEMLDRYAVGPTDVSFLHDVLEFPVNFDFSRYAYFIDAVRKDI
jgi:hypothetical protein